MKMPASIVALTAFGLTSVLLATEVHAVSLLAVDFGRVISGSPTPVQPGFNGMAGDPVQASKTEAFGAYTVTIQGEGFYSAGFNAGNVDPSVAALYEDYYYHNSTSNGVGIALAIDGVTPNTEYNLHIWSYDEDNIFSSTDTLWSPAGDTSGTSGTAVNFAEPYPTNLGTYRAMLRVSSSTSTLDVFGTTTSGGGGTRINGFMLNPVPEPANGLLAMIGAALFAVPRCRRRAQR
jgi:hypothetical protein